MGGLAAAYVAWEHPYEADSDFAYNLGLAGGILMLLLLPYSLRKRVVALHKIGSMRGWFMFHMVAGIIGPLLVLFHSTFRMESVNGGVALLATLLVTASGLVGRFLYRKIHHGLSQSRASLADRQAELDQCLAALSHPGQSQPEQVQMVREFMDFALSPPPTAIARGGHFLRVTARRWRVQRQIHLLAIQSPDSRTAVHAALKAAQRMAQFAAYERLFALWHVIHLPFLLLLVLTGSVHVVAVHAY